MAYLRPFNEVKYTISNYDGFKSLQNILFSDWPAAEVYPKSVDDFLRKIYKHVLKMVTKITALCQTKQINQLNQFIDLLD